MNWSNAVKKSGPEFLHNDVNDVRGWQSYIQLLLQVVTAEGISAATESRSSSQDFIESYKTFCFTWLRDRAEK